MPFRHYPPPWTGGRVVEGARLESVYAGNRIVGSNPTPSANYSKKMFSAIEGWVDESQRVWRLFDKLS
jgi:hypothetical protein